MNNQTAQSLIDECSVNEEVNSSTASENISNILSALRRNKNG